MGSNGMQRTVYWLFVMFLTGVFAISLIVVVAARAQPVTSPVQRAHLQQIRELFRTNGLSQAAVVLDNRGRVELLGTYEDELEVDRAFSLAQTVVGPRWVSPVTPQRVRVKAWTSCFEQLFAGRP